MPFEGGLEWPALTLDGEAQARLAPVKVKVDDISQGGAIDGEDAVARPEAGARRRRPWTHTRHYYPRSGPTAAHLSPLYVTRAPRPPRAGSAA